MNNTAPALIQAAAREPAFMVGHTVVAKGQAFWMTVKSILPGGRRFVCNFGVSEKRCGVFADVELDFKRCTVCKEPLVGNPFFDTCRGCAPDRGPFEFERDDS